MIKAKLTEFRTEITHQPIYGLGCYEPVESIMSNDTQRTTISLVTHDNSYEVFGPRPHEQEYILMTKRQYEELLVNKIMMAE